MQWAGQEEKRLTIENGEVYQTIQQQWIVVIQVLIRVGKTGVVKRGGDILPLMHFFFNSQIKYSNKRQTYRDNSIINYDGCMPNLEQYLLSCIYLYVFLLLSFL